MTQETGPQPPYPLHPSVVPRIALDYADSYNKYIFDKQQVHLQPVEASRTSGVLIPGAGPLYPVAKTEDIALPRTQSSGPDVRTRCFTPNGKKPEKGWPCLFYFHGGGWVLGNIDTENVIATNLAGRANCVVVSVDYRYARHNTPCLCKVVVLTESNTDSLPRIHSQLPWMIVGKLSFGPSRALARRSSPSTRADSRQEARRQAGIWQPSCASAP